MRLIRIVSWVRITFLTTIAVYLFSTVVTAHQLIVDSANLPLQSDKKTIGFLMTFRIANPDWADGNTEFVLLHLHTTKMRIYIEVTDRSVKMPEYFNKKACRQSPFVVSGGFFDRDKEEIRGLLISNYQVHSKVADWSSGGIFHYTKGAYRIDYTDSFCQLPTTAFALQGKPVLVRNGVNDMIEDDYKRADRISIGTTFRNNVVIFGAFSPKYEAVSAFKFAELAIEATRIAKIELDTLLNLDGAAQAALSIRPLKRFLGYGTWKYVPNVICSGNLASLKESAPH